MAARWFLLALLSLGLVPTGTAPAAADDAVAADQSRGARARADLAGPPADVAEEQDDELVPPGLHAVLFLGPPLFRVVHARRIAIRPSELVRDLRAELRRSCPALRTSSEPPRA